MNGNFMDADLRSVQQARDLAVAAREAMRAFQFAPQEEVDRICEAMVAAGMREAGRLGQLAHEETGFGYPEHKRLKNEFAAQGVWDSIKDIPTCGVLRRDDALKIIEVGAPVGVLCALTPSTNPTSTAFFKILIGEMEPDEGTYKWGVTTSQAYFPKDFGGEFDNDYNITEWLTQYSEEKDVTYVRGFLGRMLFSGEDGVKKVAVLSGGEKVRCLLSKMMISGANVLLLDEPTNHLDMESITALNNGLIKFPGVLLFTSRDHQIVQTTANRIMEIVPGGKLIDKITTYDEYLESDEMARKRQTYSVQTDDED